MLALGLSAWVMIDSQDFKEPKLDSQVVTKFLPALMSLMVDDQVRQLHTKLPPDERESAITVIEHSGSLPDACEAYIQENSVAALLAMYYTIHVTRHKDRVGLLRVLTILANCKDDRAFEDPFLHSMVIILKRFFCIVILFCKKNHKYQILLTLLLFLGQFINPHAGRIRRCRLLHGSLRRILLRWPDSRQRRSTPFETSLVHPPETPHSPIANSNKSIAADATALGQSTPALSITARKNRKPTRTPCSHGTRGLQLAIDERPHPRPVPIKLHKLLTMLYF